MNFLEWNDKLAAHFFRPEAAGRQIFLFVAEDLLDELGAATGDTWHQFVSAVKAGHSWRQYGSLSLCRKALHCLKTWRGRGLPYPAYIAYLGLFVLAAGKEGNFAPHAYYPRLRRLIGEAGSGMLPEFDHMWELWEDLERWATDEHGGELGLFTSWSIGGWVHVGLPLAQTLLTVQERHALPWIFAAARLDPTSSPSDFELCRALRTYGASVFRHRTLNVLTGNNGDESAALGVLLAAAREELEQWDGHVEEPGRPTECSVFGSLRLCASLDRVARTARFTVRCSMNRDYPEAGLSLTQVGTFEQLRCEGELLHWSTPLTDAKSRSRVDGIRFDWGVGAELREDQLGWRFRMQGCPVRILVNGESEGLRGHVEVHQLSPGTPFLIAARSDTWETLEIWGASSCRQFERVEVRQGLPVGWGLYRSAGAESDEQVRDMFPSLAFPQTIRLLLRGGIRYGRRNEYFRFGLPSVRLEGARGEETVYCNEIELPLDEGLYRLPPSLPAGIPLPIEVRRERVVIKRQPFALIDDFDWQRSRPGQLFDKFGDPADSSQAAACGAAGAVLAGLPAAKGFFSPSTSCFESRRVFFVGPIPGQVVSWPVEDLPGNWNPVWAILLGRRGRAMFCGAGLSGTRAVEASDVCCRRRLRLWKEVLYHRRKRIAPPIEPALQRLWKQYQEAARHV